MNIGILDDHELIRIGVSSVLHDTTHVVSISAACAEDLFAALESGTSCDLLLLDILMPDMDGFETFHALRDLEDKLGRNTTPVIFLSGDNDMATERRSPLLTTE